MRNNLDRQIVLVAEWTSLGADQIVDSPTVGIEVSPVRDDGVKSDVGGGWQVLSSLSAMN